jgi:hypothetical protein
MLCNFATHNYFGYGFQNLSGDPVMQLISETTGSASGSPQHCISSIVNSVNYIFIFTLYITVLYIIHIVKVLHSHTTLLSHWPSGSTVGFPPRGAAFRAPGVHPHFWNWDLLIGCLATICIPYSLLFRRITFGPCV